MKKKTIADLNRLHEIDGECRHLEKIAELLNWDAQTYLPPNGHVERAEQLALIEGLGHEKFTSSETGELLEAVADDENLSAIDKDLIRVLKRKYKQDIKLPLDFVSSCARAQGLSQAAWAKARQENNFAAFLPHLKTMLNFARKKAEYWGFTGNRAYDGLLDIYEPDMTADEVADVFVPLKERLSLLLKKIAAKPQPEAGFLTKHFPVAEQKRFCTELMQRLGFDVNRGRLDVSAHPFTCSLGAHDIRITTRYLKQNPLSSIFSTIHESGHAFYEMGLPDSLRGSSLADGASMAIHESQSRLWENVIGRSRSFWKFLLPVAQKFFPAQLGDVSLDDFYKAANQVQPSLIRTEADEVSYSLHVILRFELERSLFSGELAPEAVPEAWRQGMKDLLGIEPLSDAEGCLQDIHWSQGSFGYFPSYALGNLYGLQFREKLLEIIPDFEQQIERGDFAGIHEWLRTHIYSWGKRRSPKDLLQMVCEKKLSSKPFIDYIEAKYSNLYGL
ncbi:carboxypeptidase M32 [Breznakiellaceae bacterium SP9]